MAFVIHDPQDNDFYTEDLKDDECWQGKEELATLFRTEEEAEEQAKDLDPDQCLIGRLLIYWTNRNFAIGWKRPGMGYKEKMQQLDEEREEAAAQRIQWMMKHPDRVLPKRMPYVTSSGRSVSSKPVMMQHMSRRPMLIHDEIEVTADKRIAGKLIPKPPRPIIDVDWKTLEERVLASSYVKEKLKRRKGT